ncbi:MAG: hypothetical protein QXJ13_02550 [Candidatus Bathyarchaeia archaeon]
MAARTNLLEFIRRQIDVENDIVRSLDEALKDIQNPAVKGVLRGISLDSLKHADMYASALMLLTTAPKALSQEQLERHRGLVEKHIHMEAELIEKISSMLPTVENEKVKLLLTSILEDEKRHHALLKQVLEIIVRGETITEDEWWDIIWRSTPFHGAPGG